MLILGNIKHTPENILLHRNKNMNKTMVLLFYFLATLSSLKTIVFKGLTLEFLIPRIKKPE